MKNQKMSTQELLAKARAKLSSLQMEDIYREMSISGDVVGVAYLYSKVMIHFKNGKKILCEIWE